MYNLCRILSILALVVFCSITTFGCGSDSNADKVDDNLGKEAEKFNVQRKIVGINGITDKVLFSVEGRCSLETNDALNGALEIICKYGDHDYRKHFIGRAQNVTFISTQLRGLKVSEYRTKFTFRPQSYIPDVDLDTGG